MKISPDVLKPHPFLALLPYRTLKRLASGSAISEFPKGTTVFRAGDRCDAIYVIISGRCEAHTAGRNGATVVEAVFGPGDLLGERAYFHAEPHAATVTVVTRCVLLRIPAEELDAIFAKDYKLAGRFSQLLAKRWSVMGTRQPERDSRIRRVISVLALEPRIKSTDLVEQLAASLSAISHQQVLLVHLLPDSGATVHDWAKEDPYLHGEFRFVREVRSSGSGFCEIRLPVGNDPSYAAAVAPLISHCGRYYDYVLLHGAADLPERTARESVLQADLAYVLLRPDGAGFPQFDLLMRSLREISAHATRHTRPVVFADSSHNLVECDESLRRSAQIPSHAIHHFPSSNSGSSAGSRGTLCVNRIAREIARCRIGLALSSGGAKGLAHVGVIQVLEENGIEVDAITGASMGAYVASLWASGHDGTQLERIAKVHEGRWGLKSIIDPVFPPRLGFLRTNRIARRLRSSLGDIPFSGLVRPLRVVATHLDTLDRVVFEKGEVALAVEASIAIPGICVPVCIDGEMYVDGGVADPLPVDVLEEMGIERIIAVNVIPTAEQLRNWQQAERELSAQGRTRWSLGKCLNQHLNYFAHGNVFDTMVQAFVGAQMLVAENATRRADVVLRPVDCDAWWYDFTHPDKYINLGRRVAEAALPQLLALANSTPANEPPTLPKKPVAFPSTLRAA